MAPAARPEEAGDTIPVQLTRMEGDLKLILFQVTDVSRRTGTLETKVSTLQSETQALAAAAKASTEKAEALALALKEAKEAVEATALQESNKAAGSCAGQDRQGCAGMVSGYKGFCRVRCTGRRAQHLPSCLSPSLIN